MDLSIIIPAYNEADRLPQTLRHLAEHFRAGQRSTEVIVVDDGSTDATAEVALAGAIKVRLLRQSKNLGKGAAVRTGMAAAAGDWRYLCDADLSTPTADFEHLWSRRHQADIILGSRRVAGAKVEKHQAWWKEMLGQLGNGLIQLLAAPGIKDTQCGFKLFNRRTAILFQQQRLERWGYDFEILFLARMVGLTMIEVPVTWVNDARSKVRSRDYLTTLFDLARIHYFHLRGYYKFT